MQSPQFNLSKLTPLFEYLKKQQESEKNSRVIELSITFILISFFLFFAIRPTFFTISTLVGDINSKKELSSKMKSKIDQIISAQDNFANIQEKYFLVEEALPTSQNFIEALKMVDTVTVNNNVMLEKISFAESDKDFFSTKISTISSFSSILDIINKLSKSRRVIDIPQITFSQDKDSQAAGKVGFILPIDIFYWNNNEKK